MSDLDRTLAALADPARRSAVEALRRKPRRAGELAALVGLSPPAMSRHLRVLRNTGLVEEEHGGEDARVRVYRLRRERFGELRRWLDDVGALLGRSAPGLQGARRAAGRRAGAGAPMSEPPRPAPGDAASATVFVAVPPEVAFDVFTREIDLWWRQGPRFRIGRRHPGQLSFEPGVGGRLLETVSLPAGPRTFVVGRVTAWDPPSRLELEWRGVNFEPDEKTFVAVRFEPSGRGTLVSVRHHGWSALPEGHPVRHGLAGAAFSRMVGLWWGDLLTSLREHAAARG